MASSQIISIEPFADVSHLQVILFSSLMMGPSWAKIPNLSLLHSSQQKILRGKFENLYGGIYSQLKNQPNNPSGSRLHLNPID